MTKEYGTWVIEAGHTQKYKTKTKKCSKKLIKVIIICLFITKIKIKM